MKIIKWPNSVLKEVSKGVTKPLDQQVVLDMYAAMKQHGGIGLSAIQIGIKERFFITDTGSGLNVYINPKITSFEGGRFETVEGCLSTPGFFDNVKRFEKVTISFLNLKMEPKTSILNGIDAHVVQHECEHLDGKMFLDHLNSSVRDVVRVMMRKSKPNKNRFSDDVMKQFLEQTRANL